MPGKRKFVRSVNSEELETAMKRTKESVTTSELTRVLSFLSCPIDWSGERCSVFEGAATHQTHPCKMHRHLGWRGKTVLAHRLFFSLFQGSPEGDMVLHTCRSAGACVSPMHLIKGDAQRNADDRIRDDTAGLKLSVRDIDTIRARAANGERHHVIAASYPVSRSMIQKIVAKKNFKKV